MTSSCLVCQPHYVTDRLLVDSLFLKSNSENLPDYAQRATEYQHLSDFALVDDQSFLIAGAAWSWQFEQGNIVADVEMLHVEPQWRLRGFGGYLIQTIQQQISTAMRNATKPAQLTVYASLCSDGGGVLCYRLVQALRQQHPDWMMRFWADCFGLIRSSQDVRQAVLCEKY